MHSSSPIICYICEVNSCFMVNRIRELLDARQLSPTQFADLIGVGRPVVSHILSERNKPSLEVVQKILDAFPDVSLSWLMKGTGPMLAEAPLTLAVAPALVTAPVAPPPTPPVPPETVAVETFAGLPASPASATHFNLSAQPQDFTHVITRAAQPASMAAPRSQPPKFRPASATATPLAAATAPVQAAGEPVAAAPAPTPTLLPPASPTPTVVSTPAAAFIAVPLPTPQPTLAGLAPTGQPPEYQPAPLAPQPAANQAAVIPAPATATAPAAWALPAAGPAVEAPVAEVPGATPSPAAALSFLGEPGKAIRRIVIFYRDGSFSDYVPEGY